MSSTPDLFQPSQSGAILSPCGRYRYRLERRWDAGPTACFIMLNPSTADANHDDPTIRRCIGFAKREGCGGLVVVNLFSYRATDPRALLEDRNPLGGPEHEREFHRAITKADGPVIAAWGSWSSKRFPNPGHWTAQRYGDRLLCLGKTKDGRPRHPLYVKADAPLIALHQKPQEGR